MNLIATKASLRALLPREVLTSGMSEAVRCTVRFDASWEGLTKIAVFSDGYHSVDVPDVQWDGDTFPIPSSVTAKAGATVRLGIYGTDGETVALPTVWCSLGVVQEGADPGGAGNLEADNPVWAQLLARQAALEEAAGRTLLPCTMLTRDGKSGTATVHFRGLVAGERYALYLYTANRRNGRRQKAWRHTPNYDIDRDTAESRKGYGCLAGTKVACLSDGVGYPSVPDWMPNGGYLQTEWEVSSGSEQIEIDLKRWLLPMLKPLNPAANDPWASCGMIGLGQCDNASLLMQWRLVRLEDGAVGECRDTLKVGAPRDNKSGNNIIEFAGDCIARLYTAIV